MDMLVQLDGGTLMRFERNINDYGNLTFTIEQPPNGTYTFTMFTKSPIDMKEFEFHWID